MILDRISHFELLEELPQGGQAQVYKARDLDVLQTTRRTSGTVTL